MKRLLLGTGLVALIAVSVAVAQLGESASKADPRVQEALDEADISYSIDEDGDFRVVFGTKDERTQLAFINSDTNKFLTFEIREVWSPAYRSEGMLPRDVANQLLIDNRRKKLGAWQVIQNEEVYIAVFSAKVDANLDSGGLAAALVAVLESADNLEAELVGTDDF